MSTQYHQLLNTADSLLAVCFSNSLTVSLFVHSLQHAEPAYSYTDEEYAP